MANDTNKQNSKQWWLAVVFFCCLSSVLLSISLPDSVSNSWVFGVSLIVAFVIYMVFYIQMIVLAHTGKKLHCAFDVLLGAVMSIASIAYVCGIFLPSIRFHVSCAIVICCGVNALLLLALAVVGGVCLAKYKQLPQTFPTATGVWLLYLLVYFTPFFFNHISWL